MILERVSCDCQPFATTVWPSGSAAERAVEVAPQVFDILDSGGKTQKVGRAGGVGAFDRGAVLDERLDAAERGRALPQSNPRRRCDRGLRPVANTDRQHAAEAALHLPASRPVAGMMRQA